MVLDMPGSPRPLTGGVLARGSAASAIFGLPMRFLMYNPFDMELAVESLDFKSFIQGIEIGGFKKTFAGNAPMVLKPKDYTLSPEFSVGMSWASLKMIGTLKSDIDAHYLELHVEGTFTTRAGSIQITAPYASTEDVHVCWADTLAKCPALAEKRGRPGGVWSAAQTEEEVEVQETNRAEIGLLRRLFVILINIFDALQLQIPSIVILPCIFPCTMPPYTLYIISV